MCFFSRGTILHHLTSSRIRHTQHMHVKMSKARKTRRHPRNFHTPVHFSPIVIHKNSSLESESFINPSSQSAFFWPSSTTTHSSSRDTHTSAAVFAVRFLSSFVVFAARLSYAKNATQKIAWTENSVKSHALLFPRFTVFHPITRNFCRSPVSQTHFSISHTVKFRKSQTFNSLLFVFHSLFF